ncbi:ferritin-like domain-containing protein [soil metagenome]
MAHESMHEPYESLSPETRDMHRAIVSLMEELEAVDWYQQRADVTPSADLKAVLEHNRDEEIEHAIMTLEWIRRRNAKFDENLRTYLFTEGPITEVEASIKAGEGGEASADAAPEKTNPRASSGGDGSLGIGSLKTTITKSTGA